MAASDRIAGTNANILFLLTGDTPTADEVRLTADYTSFNWNRQVDTVDVTAGNETERYEKATIESMDWSLMMFDSNPAYLSKLKPQGTGTLSIYKNGVIQIVTISGSPTGGTFTITVNGETTTGIAFGAAASVVETALEALTSVTAGDVAVTGSAGGPFTLTWDVINGTTIPVSVSSDGALLTGGTSPAATTTYSQGISFTALITGMSTDVSFDGAIEIDLSGVRVGDMIVDIS